MSDHTGRLHYSWIVLGVGTLTVFGALGLGRFGYTVVLPSMQDGLSLSNTQAGVLATANLIGYLALSAIGGALASRYGPRTVITAGLTLVGVSMLLTASARGFPSAALWRALTGVGSGASNVPVMGLLAAWFTAKRRGLATGIGVLGSSIGVIFIGPLAPRVMASFGENGWRVCWVVYAAAALAIAVLAWTFLRDSPAEKGLRPLGAVGKESEPGPGSRPLQWGRVYKSLPVWHLGLVYVAFGFSYIIYMTFFTKRLIAEGGYSPHAAGQLFSIMGWLSFLCMTWGYVSDLIGRKWALVIVYVIQGTSFCLFGIWPTPAGFTISAVLFGLSAWSIPAIMAAACGDVLGARMAPAALGFITLFFGIGQAAAPSIAGAIADATGSFSPAFLLAGGVAFLGAVGSAFLHPASTTTPEDVPR